MSNSTDVPMVAGRCISCGKVWPVHWSFRHNSGCKDCLKGKGIIATLVVIEKGIPDPENVGLTLEDALTWKEYCERKDPTEGPEASVIWGAPGVSEDPDT